MDVLGGRLLAHLALLRRRDQRISLFVAGPGLAGLPLLPPGIRGSGAWALAAGGEGVVV